MSDNHDRRPPQSIISCAAENGLVLGAYICVLVIATGLSASMPAASLIVWGGSLAMPVLVYKLLRRNYRTAVQTWGFTELLGSGIASFMLGSLFPAVLVYAGLKFLAPDFIATQLAMAAAVFEDASATNPEFAPWADTMRTMISTGKMPTPADVAAQTISFNIICGMFISLLVAPMVLATHRNKKN